MLACVVLRAECDVLLGTTGVSFDETRLSLPAAGDLSVCPLFALLVLGVTMAAGVASSGVAKLMFGRMTCRELRGFESVQDTV